MPVLIYFRFIKKTWRQGIVVRDSGIELSYLEKSGSKTSFRKKFLGWNDINKIKLAWEEITGFNTNKNRRYLSVLVIPNQNYPVECNKLTNFTPTSIKKFCESVIKKSGFDKSGDYPIIKIHNIEIKYRYLLIPSWFPPLYNAIKINLLDPPKGEIMLNRK